MTTASARLDNAAKFVHKTGGVSRSIEFALRVFGGGKRKTWPPENIKTHDTKIASERTGVFSFEIFFLLFPKAC